MNTFQLMEIIKDIPGFLGVYPCDLLPRDVTARTLHTGLIINTDPHNMPGQHWVAVYLDKGKGEFFDSFGREPQREIQQLLERCCPAGWAYSPHSIQSMVSSVCGNYCLMFLIFRLLNLTYPDFISIFSRDVNLNDFIVKYLTTKAKK